MKETYYSGIEGAEIIIQQPTDIYILLDWCQSQMIELEENTSSHHQKERFSKAASFLSKLMELAEKEGFGNHETLEEHHEQLKTNIK